MVPESVTGSQNHENTAHTRDDGVFLEQLGSRVRAARGARGLSRKLLARDAGVSERYLAQLEAGRGNISILLLRRVAEALGIGLDVLVGAGERGYPARVALIGLRGAGKSTLGRLLAEDLGMPFIELNDAIERLSGLGVAEIFHLYGAEGYRRFERRCLDQIIAAGDSVVLATGGGIVAEAETYEALLAAFFTVWLRAVPSDHMARVRAQGDLRPMAGSSEAMAELERILASREPLYRRADRALQTSDLSVEDCRGSLLALLAKDGIHAPADDRKGSSRKGDGGSA